MPARTPVDGVEAKFAATRARLCKSALGHAAQEPEARSQKPESINGIARHGVRRTWMMREAGRYRYTVPTSISPGRGQTVGCRFEGCVSHELPVVMSSRDCAYRSFWTGFYRAGRAWIQLDSPTKRRRRTNGDEAPRFIRLWRIMPAATMKSEFPEAVL
ncbi:hypothetical protein CCMA1212_008260 [Trichoderma ghanense]|uniref:Uncharacterized protein n=1 Tax=Trichoderma ghanense TaxID=65468 RepID=A0ABY2GV41_9HYPO